MDKKNDTYEKKISGIRNIDWPLSRHLVFVCVYIITPNIGVAYKGSAL